MKILEKKSTLKISKTYRALGTVISLTIYGHQDEELLDKTYQLIKYYEQLFTVNRDQSELMAVNHKAGIEPVQVSGAVYGLTKIALEKSKEAFGFSDAKLPTQAEIDEKLKIINPDRIILRDDEFSIFLPEKGMEIDLGAIAKGYIADRIKDFWHAYGISSGIINLGGNLLLVGEAPHQTDKKWRIGIRNPLTNDKKSVLQLLSGEGSVVTSGISERYLKVNDKIYHHIIDSKTGYPHHNQLASVTILSKKSIDGEIETTRLFFADGPIENWLTENPEVYGAIFISKDKKIKAVGIPQSQIYVADQD